MGKFTISAVKFDGKTMPFRGFSGANVIATEYSWSAWSIGSDGTVSVSGVGFDTDKEYRCYVQGTHFQTGGSLKVAVKNTAAKTGLGCAAVETPACRPCHLPACWPARCASSFSPTFDFLSMSMARSSSPPPTHTHTHTHTPHSPVCICVHGGRWEAVSVNRQDKITNSQFRQSPLYALFRAATGTDKLVCGTFAAGNFKVSSGKGVVNLGVFEVDSSKKDKVEVKKASFVKSIALAYNACTDNAKDGDETDVDCGGAMCGKVCSDGQGCKKDMDCSTTFQCKSGKCAPKKASPSTIPSNTWKFPPRTVTGVRMDSVNRPLC